jgi:hypothetical protein
MLHGGEGRVRCIGLVQFSSEGQTVLRVSGPAGTTDADIARVESWVVDTSYLHTFGAGRAGSSWYISSCTGTHVVRGGSARSTYMMGLHASTLRDFATVRVLPWLGAEASHFAYYILCSSCSRLSHGPNGLSSCACFLAGLNLASSLDHLYSYKYYRVTRHAPRKAVLVRLERRFASRFHLGGPLSGLILVLRLLGRDNWVF